MDKNNKNPLRDIVGSETVYEGAIIDVRVDRVKFPSGSIKKREVVLHRPAVAILAVDNEGKILLVSQYRHAVDEELLELPAGLVEESEAPAATAARELQEEIGYKPGRLEELFTFYSSPGFSNEKIIFFYASDLEASKLPEDDDEYIKVERYAVAELERMIEQCIVKDGKAIVGLYWYKQKVLGEQCR